MPPAAAYLADRALVLSDIAGSTRTAAKLGDLAVFNLVRAFHDRAAGLASRHNGRLIKELGDGFLAVFDDAADALHFARELPTVFYEDETISGEGLSLKLAIHYGRVSVGETPYGEDVFGRNVNLVARLEGLAAPHEIVISDAAMQRLSAEELGLVNRRETSELRDIGKVGFGRLGFARLQVAGA